MQRLSGKVTLVTGAGHGIGEGIARRFAREGAAIGVMDYDMGWCERVANDINGQGGRALALCCDIRDVESVQMSIEEMAQTFGPITVLVNNAAVMPSGRLHETPPDEFDRCISINLRGTYLVTRAVIPGMLELGQGCIIHMASITATRGLPGIAVYSATKGALVALTRAMSTDYAHAGIRVNSIAPGTIDSPMLHNFLAEQSDPEGFRRLYDEMHPIGRVGTIEEVANVAVFLASDEASFVTGSNYEVDGGLAAKGEQPQDEPA